MPSLKEQFLTKLKKITMSEVVKVQIPLETNDPEFRALMYNQQRRMVQQKLDYTTKRLMGTDVKAFFEAEWRETKKEWTIGKRVKDREW